MELPSFFERYRSELERELRTVVGDSPLAIYDMARYHLGWIDAEGQPRKEGGGKALRPTFCLLACEAVGGDWRVALPAAAALELMHNFTLIHDDIEDGSQARRGRITVWHLWGEPQAINAGDSMHALAQLALFRLEDKEVAHQKVLLAARLLDETCLKLCEGQYLDISYETRLDIGVEDYLRMIEHKTAELMGCSSRLGALLGTEDEETVERLGVFGRKLGLAFQIRDDILGIWGKEETTGKPIASDLQKKKKSLPVVFGLERSKGGEREELRAIYGKDALSPRDIDRVLQILDGLGAAEHAQQVAEGYYGEALVELEGLPLSRRAREELQSLATFLISRDY